MRLVAEKTGIDGEIFKAAINEIADLVTADLNDSHVSIAVALGIDEACPPLSLAPALPRAPASSPS